MILRIWTISVDPLKEAEYLAYARSRSRAMFLAQDGCLGVFFLRHPDGRHAACSLWRDARAVEALANSASYQQTAAGLEATGALRGAAEVVVFDVTGGALSPALLPTLDAAQSR